MPETPQPETQERFFYGWIVVLGIFCIVVVSAGMFTSFGVFLNPLLNAFGWTRGTISLAYSIFMLTGGIGTLFIGGMLERWSIRHILLFSGLIHALGITLTSLTTELWHLYFFYGIIASLGRSTFVISYVTLVNRWFQEKRGIAMGIIMSGQGVGPFLFSPIATSIIITYSWETAFFAIGIVMAIGVLIGFLLIRNHPAEMGFLPYGASAASQPAETARQAAPPRTGKVWGQVLRNEYFWLLSLTHFFCCICHAIPLVHVAAFANVSGLSAISAAWVLSVMGLTSFVGRLFWGFFADKYGSRFALMLTTFLQSAFMLWLINAADPIVFFLYAVFWGFGYAGVTMQYGIISRDVFSTTLRGPAFAGISCFAMMGMAGGGYIGGILYDISHSYITSWWVSLVSGLIAALIAMEMARKAEAERVTLAAASGGLDHASELAAESQVTRS